MGDFAKLADILIVMVAGSIEDERLFSVLNYILGKYRQSLNESMEKCVVLMAQDLFDMDNFPWAKGLRLWYEAKSVRGRYRT